jgi:hypothetical protein
MRNFSGRRIWDILITFFRCPQFRAVQFILRQRVARRPFNRQQRNKILKKT